METHTNTQAIAQADEPTSGHADLSFYFAIHQAQRDALVRYRDAVSTLAEVDRVERGKALAKWAKGFVFALEEHHYAEDTFFFPSLKEKVPSAGQVIDELESQHRHLDDLLERWPGVAAALADPKVTFLPARAEATAFAQELCDFLHDHLAIEDDDVLPLFWRHYSAVEYDAVQDEAIKKSKKAGMWFIAPFTVDCFAEGDERDAFLASVPGILRLLHRIVRPRYDRLATNAFGVTVGAPAA
jgi:hemerythrin-like domain-containing protein